MARIENLLTAKQVEAALRKGIPVQLNDGGGLYLSITEKNKGTWFMRGRLNGVAKRRVLGDEKVSLAEARLLRNKEKKALKSGIDTVAEKKAALKKVEEEGRTFGMISEEWLNFWKNDKDDKTINEDMSDSTIRKYHRYVSATCESIENRTLRPMS